MSTKVLSDKKLDITEVFQSIQGEGHYSGIPCSFIRLTGCNLLCKWCDTTYAYKNGESLEINDIINEINIFNNELVEITGGEPLLQDNVYDLIDYLHQNNNRVLLETNGSLFIDRVPEYVHIIMDIKTPSSGGYTEGYLKNLPIIKKTDEIKIVISNYNDFKWALNMCLDNNLFDYFEKPILVQPAFGILNEQDLAAWILDSKVFFKLGIQLHKYIFGEHVRGV
ncbi:MAG: radical SAM protein [Spirochaetia bacterium]|nr:radical SAM protein [Spirochaetia bacterium]